MRPYSTQQVNSWVLCGVYAGPIPAGPIPHSAYSHSTYTEGDPSYLSLLIYRRVLTDEYYRCDVCVCVRVACVCVCVCPGRSNAKENSHWLTESVNEMSRIIIHPQNRRRAKCSPRLKDRFVHSVTLLPNDTYAIHPFAFHSVFFLLHPCVFPYIYIYIYFSQSSALRDVHQLSVFTLWPAVWGVRFTARRKEGCVRKARLFFKT